MTAFQRTPEAAEILVAAGKKRPRNHRQQQATSTTVELVESGDENDDAASIVCCYYSEAKSRSEFGTPVTVASTALVDDENQTVANNHGIHLPLKDSSSLTNRPSSSWSYYTVADEEAVKKENSSVSTRGAIGLSPSFGSLWEATDSICSCSRSPGRSRNGSQCELHESSSKKSLFQKQLNEYFLSDKLEEHDHPPLLRATLDAIDDAGQERDVSEYEEYTVKDEEDEEEEDDLTVDAPSHTSSGVALSVGQGGYYYSQHEQRWLLEARHVLAVDVVPPLLDAPVHPIPEKNLQKGNNDDDSDTVSTAHASFLDLDCGKNEHETVSLLSHDDNAEHSYDYEEVSVASHESEDPSVVIPVPSNPTNSTRACDFPKVQVVEQRLPQEARQRQFSVVSLTFMAHTLTPAKIDRALHDAWEMLQPGGTLYICHVVMSSNNDQNVTDLRPYIPRHMQDCLCAVPNDGVSEAQLAHEAHTRQILNQSKHSFDAANHDTVHRWHGVKPTVTMNVND